MFSFLDRNKSGTEPRNIKTRETIRYLEQRFKYPSPYIVGQKSDETMLYTNSNVYIPGTYVKFLGCCLYFHRQLKNQKVFLVTDNDELRMLAEGFGMYVIDSGTWQATYRKR